MKRQFFDEWKSVLLVTFYPCVRVHHVHVFLRISIVFPWIFRTHLSEFYLSFRSPPLMSSFSISRLNLVEENPVQWSDSGASLLLSISGIILYYFIVLILLILKSSISPRWPWNSLHFPSRLRVFPRITITPSICAFCPYYRLSVTTLIYIFFILNSLLYIWSSHSN